MSPSVPAARSPWRGRPADRSSPASWSRERAASGRSSAPAAATAREGRRGVHDRGRLVTIWSSADGGEEQNRTALVRVATRRRGRCGSRRRTSSARAPRASRSHSPAARPCARSVRAPPRWWSGRPAAADPDRVRDGRGHGHRCAHDRPGRGARGRRGLGLPPRAGRLDARSARRRRSRPGRDRTPGRALRARRAGRARGLVGDRRGARPRGHARARHLGRRDPALSPRWGLAERQLP